MTTTRSAAFAILALLAQTAAAAPPAVRDFELPPGPTATPTADPPVQGPVDPDAPVATRPRPLASEAPRPAPAEPTPTGQPPAEATPAPARSATPAPPAERALPRPRPAQADDASAAASQPGASSAPAVPPAEAAPAPLAPPPAAPAQAASSAPRVALPWGWLAAALALALAAGAGGLWQRRRTAAQAAAPQIAPLVAEPATGAQGSIRVEPSPPARPAPAGSAAARPLPRPAFGHGEALVRIEAAPRHLTRSLMAATFSCKVSLRNQGEAPLEDVAVELDLTTAHASVPAGDQLAAPDRALPEVGRIACIAPGETCELAQDVRLPTAAIRTLRQGQAELYVPLMRVRVRARGQAPVARTFLVGTLPGPQAKRLQPFRLDEMPQTYRLIGVAALD